MRSPSKRDLPHRKVITAMLARSWQDSDGEVHSSQLVVVCDDGATFAHVPSEGTWYELPPVPGTFRAEMKDLEDRLAEAEGRQRMLDGLNKTIAKQKRKQKRN